LHLRKPRPQATHLQLARKPPAPEADNLPLRLAGGLHALLLSGKARKLASIYRKGAIADAYMQTLL